MFNKNKKCLAGFKNILATGSWDKNVILWDLNNGSKIAYLIGHTENVNCIALKDCNTLISGSGDSTLKIWNLSITIDDKSEHEKAVLNSIDFKNLNGHNSDVYCVDTCLEYIASGGADSLVIIWNFSGELLHKMTGHLGIVRFIHLDEHKLVTGGDAKRIIVWDYKVCN